jgi:GNAT superfamily N-acetyltransferase
MQFFNPHFPDFLIKNKIEEKDIPAIHNYLTHSYWSENIPLAVVEKAIAHSLNFGVYHGENLIGFARAVTDFSTFAYVADVFILEQYRGKGLSKWLMQTMIAHPQLQGLRRWALATRDAHGLYEKVGFKSLAKPDRWMEMHFPDVYKKDIS